MKNLSYENEPKVRAWIDSVVKAGCTIHSLSPVNIIYKKNKELLFALIKADVSDPMGNKLDEILFLRGHACIVVPEIKNRTTGKKAFLMIRQRRIGNGKVNLEFPAGMLDRNIHNAKKVAITELFEETGLKVSETDIFPLCDHLLLCSPGASDEGIYYFGCSVVVSGRGFARLEGREISGPSENEHIAVTLMSRKQAEKESASLQARLGFYLFENVSKKRNGHENIFRKRKHPRKPS